MHPETVVRLYQEFISTKVKEEDLRDADGNYVPENKWNDSVSSVMHLVSTPNNLFAEIRLAADVWYDNVKMDRSLAIRMN